MINYCNVTFDLEFGTIDGRSMTVEFFVNDQLTALSTVDTTVVNFKMLLPGVIKMKFFGKNYQTDTKIDQNGCVTNDVYVKIKSIALDNIKLSELFLYKNLFLKTDHNKNVQSPYIGFNGMVSIDFDCDNVFSQYLKFNNYN